MNDPYALPNGVLRNRLGITDPQMLTSAEADITRARLVMLTERRLPGAYDLSHLQAFHAAVLDKEPSGPAAPFTITRTPPDG